MNLHPVAYNKILFARTKILVTLATQVDEVAAYQLYIAQSFNDG